MGPQAAPYPGALRALARCGVGQFAPARGASIRGRACDTRRVSRIELLRSIPMFEGLGDDDMEPLAASLTERRLRAGEMIFDMGDAGREMYIVAEGHVNIHLPGEASRRVSLKDIARGE